METVGEFDQNNAQVGNHREDHLAEGFGLLLFLGDVRVPRDLRDSVNQLRDILAEELVELFLGGQRVFENVMKQPDGDGCLVEPHVGQDVGHVERMDEIGFA